MLGVEPTGQEIQRITNLTKSALTTLLNSPDASGSTEDPRIATVVTLLRKLVEARVAATGTTDRGKSTAAWLHAASVRTSRGTQSPIDILADADLATEALNDLLR